jgi:hypothetical protein
MKDSKRRGASSRSAADAAASPARNLAESPLAWLARRKDKDGQPMLADEEFDAGEKLRCDFWFAEMTPRVTANWSLLLSTAGGSAPGRDRDLKDAVIAARERVRRALSAVGPELAGILIDVCCHLKGLEASEKASGWPQRSGKIILQIALRQLARHYGMLRAVEGADRTPVRVRHWGTSDYRAQIEPDAG